MPRSSPNLRRWLMPLALSIRCAWIAMADRRHIAHRVTFDRDFASLLDRHEYTLLIPGH